MALSARVTDVPSHVVSAAARAPLPVPHAVHAPRGEVRLCVAVPMAAAGEYTQQYETLELMPEEAIKVRP
jgi:hypothetical protein